MNIYFDQFVISSLDVGKGEIFFDLIERNRNRLADFFPNTVAATTTLEKTLNYMNEVSEKIKNRSYFPFIIKEQLTDKYIGLVDFKNISWKIPKTEMGYFIDKNYQGRGIITQAGELSIDYIVKEYGIKKILCRISPLNEGSVKVARRLKFEKEGTIRNDFRTKDGAVVDLDYYGRIF